MKLPTAMFLLGCLAAPLAVAANVRLDAVSVEKKLLPNPTNAPDAAGIERPFGAVYLVRVKGAIPTQYALPVHLFVGHHPIREYGATPDGIYFKVYDPSLVKSLHGKPFRYAIDGKSVRETALIFKAPIE